MTKITQLLTNNNPAISEFLNKFDTFLFDCDGVIWHGSKPINKVPETINWLKETMKKRCLFVTNNSTKSRDSYLDKFLGMGIHITKDELFSSSYLTAVYLKNVLNFPEDKKVFVIGMDGIKEELNLLNIKHYSLPDDHPVDDEALSKLGPNQEVGALVIGMDRHINFAKYAQGYQLLTQTPQIHFIATNEDSTYPLNGTLYPGTGSVISPLVNSTKRTPTVVGKPNLSALESIKELYDLDLSRTCMVGDRLNTDIQFGLNGGLGTLLVMTGVTKEHELKESEIFPEYQIESVAHLLI